MIRVIVNLSINEIFSGKVHYICLRQNVNKAARSPKQGYQWPQKWTCVHPIYFLNLNS